MYQQFFGFTTPPFAKDIDPAKLFMTDMVKEALKRFDYIIEHRGIMLLTGDPGTGKTVLIRHLISQLHNNSYRTAYLPLSTVGVYDFYCQLNDKIGGERAFRKSSLFKSIQNQIINLAVNQNIIPAIIFDEAHLLKDQNFRELQIISNFNLDTLLPAIIVIAGQSNLLERIRSLGMDSFNQRISIKYHMQHFNAAETKKYILHQFKICGQDNPLLNEPAFNAAFKVSKGTPRLIGAIVIKALTIAVMKKSHVVTEEDVILASQEIL